MTHLLLWGNAYSQIIRNGKGEIVALYPLMPDRMTVDRDEHGRLYYEYLVYDGDDVDGRTGTDPKANGKIVLVSGIRLTVCIIVRWKATGISYTERSVFRQRVRKSRRLNLLFILQTKESFS